MKHAEKFKYSRVAFTSDGRQDIELDVQCYDASFASFSRLKRCAIKKGKTLAV